MSKNWITFLALKNIFTLFKICIIFGFPLLVAYIMADSYGTWDDIKENGFWIVTGQEGLFLFFWLREMLELTIKKKPEKIDSQLIERNYIYGSILLFFWALFFFEYTPYRHGPDLYVLLFIIINFGFIISGIALTISAWKSIWTVEGIKRKPIAWILTVATLMAISYFAIPYGAKSCRPSAIDILLSEQDTSSGYGVHLNPIERIWKYCF